MASLNQHGGGLRRRLASLKTAKGWEVEMRPSTFAPNGSHAWSNADMDPVPVEERTWTTLNYIMYWISDAFNPATWEMASSMIAIGMSWRLVLPCIVIGNIIIAIPITLNGAAGATTHVPFPVLNRSSFGFWFSYFSVISRVVLACFWFGVQTYTGSECVYQMIRAIWPSFERLPNHLPESANITSAGLLSYFLYWLIQFPFLLVSPQKIRYLFVAKAILVPAMGLSMMIWAFAVTGGGPIFKQGNTLRGSALGWAFMSNLNSVIGNYATLSVNIPDFTRYAKGPRDQYIQMLIIPVFFTFVAFMGIVATSAGFELYGAYFWDPLRLIGNWDNRAAAFFASFAWTLAVLGTNISANSLSAANDFAALMPKYINIRRGQILCAVIGGWAITPWNILASASGFLNFMAGYTVFLGPICAIMVCDYYVVHKQKLDIPSLYRPHGRYRYVWGVNWRALAAIIVSVPPNLPGLINVINSSIDVGGAQYLYDIAWLLGVTLASTVYLGLSFLFPPRETLLEEPIWSDADETRGDGSSGAEKSSTNDEEVGKDEKSAGGGTFHVLDAN